jgi:hypothetical protein
MKKNSKKQKFSVNSRVKLSCRPKDLVGKIGKVVSVVKYYDYSGHSRSLYQVSIPKNKTNLYLFSYELKGV